MAKAKELVIATQTIETSCSECEGVVRFVGDDTLHADSEDEDLEGATGTIAVVVDPVSGHYFVVMPGLDLAEATFVIER